MDPWEWGERNNEMRTNAIYRIFLERTMGTISNRIVVGGNRFAYDTLRMHADVSKVIPKMNCFRDIFGRVIAEFCRM